MVDKCDRRAQGRFITSFDSLQDMLITHTNMQAYSHLRDQSDAAQEHFLESKEAAYRGFARVNLSCLSPASSPNRKVCHKHVERLRAIFSEQGVRRNDPDHRIPVLISEELLSQTLLKSNLSESDLFDRSPNDQPILDLPDESLRFYMADIVSLLHRAFCSQSTGGGLLIFT